MKLAFTIPGKPVPKGRPRVVRRGARSFTYTPKRTREYERAVHYTARGAVHYGGWRLGETRPVALTLRVYGARANADMDNVSKALCDGMEGVVFANDKQVVSLVVQRLTGGEPRVEVEVEVLG